MRSFRTAGSLLATALTLALAGACSDPELISDLQTEGPPEVVEVNVLSEGAVFGISDPSGIQLGEAATYCRPGEKYKVHTTYCPLGRDDINAPIPGDRETTPLMDVVPYSPGLGFGTGASMWHVRLIFDELLDPDIETLTTDETGTVGSITDADPVTLKCGGVELAYEGFYDPAGNWLSYPPGPALVVMSDEFVATGTDDCEITINSGVVTDKDGEDVPSDQLGPYNFGIAALEVASTTPADTEEGVDPVGDDLGQVVQVAFNAPVDLATVDASTLVLEDEAGDPVPATIQLYSADPTDPAGSQLPDVVAIVPDAPLDELATYTVTIDSGITDIEGGPLTLAEPIVVTFITGEAL